MSQSDHRSTVEKIARQALDRILEEFSGDVWGREDEALQIIIEAVEAGEREGEIRGIAMGAQQAAETAAAAEKIRNNMFTWSPSRRGRWLP